MNKNPYNIENPVFSDVVYKLNEEFFAIRVRSSGFFDISEFGKEFSVSFDRSGNDEIHFGENCIVSKKELKKAMPKRLRIENYEDDEVYNFLLAYSKKQFNEFLDSVQTYKFN